MQKRSYNTRKQNKHKNKQKNSSLENENENKYKNQTKHNEYDELKMSCQQITEREKNVVLMIIHGTVG